MLVINLFKLLYFLVQTQTDLDVSLLEERIADQHFHILSLSSQLDNAQQRFKQIKSRGHRR